MDSSFTMAARELLPIAPFMHGLVFCLGCMIGSFLNVVVWRIPQGMSLLSPPSHCPNCGHEIAPWENIPIVSWLFLRGRCSGCHQPISVRYPLGEAATGCLFLLVWYAIYLRNLPLAVLPGYFYLTGILLSAALIDINHRYIPNELTYSGWLVSLMLALLLPGGRLSLCAGGDPSHGDFLFRLGIRPLERLFQQWMGTMMTPKSIELACADWLIGILAGGVLLGIVAVAGNALFRKTVMGWGDVKLLAACGGFLGGDSVVFIVMAGAVMGLVWGLLRRIVFRRGDWSVAFAPFLGIGALMWMCFGNWFWFLMHHK